MNRAKRFHPHLKDRFQYADAQLVIAREHGFVGWAKFAAHIEALCQPDGLVATFEACADALASGDAASLQHTLNAHPSLIATRSQRAHNAMLLHYIGANGVEDYRQKTPANAVRIADILLRAGAEVDATANIYGVSTTLSLVASSVHPERAGVQLPLMELLLRHRAIIDGVPGSANPILAALHNGRGEAARFLVDHGASLNLESAAGTGRLAVVRELVISKNVSDDEIRAGLAWACEYGYSDVVAYLLDAGAVPDVPHLGQTPLHWAAIGAKADVARLLLSRGASAYVVNQYGATPLGQALWSAAHSDERSRYDAVIAELQ